MAVLTGGAALRPNVSTRRKPRAPGYRRDGGDGFIVCVTAAGARIVVDGLGYTNEVALHPSGRWLYVNETFGRRLSRFTVAAYEVGTIGRPHLDSIVNRKLRNISSIAFAGPDRRTAVLGCLLGGRLAVLDLPCAADEAAIQGHLLAQHWRSVCSSHRQSALPANEGFNSV